tara:strand:- start:458 stop:934 length:477 start_codon:yes stop_codon:yes gene_type:complete
MEKKIKYILILILSGLLFSCGFKPLNQKAGNLINFQNINIVGEQRIAYKIKSSIALLSDKKSEKKYNAQINIKETLNKKIKNKKNQTTRYNLSINVNLELIEIANNNIIQKTFENNEDYAVAATHSKTIINKKNAVNNIIRLITDDINTFIIVMMRNR